MKTCPHCAEQVQDKATKCPYCKAAIFSSNPGLNALIGVIVFVVLFVVFYKGFGLLAAHESEKLMKKVEADSAVLMQRFREDAAFAKDIAAIQRLGR